MLAQVLRDFTEALVIPFDAAAAMVFEGLIAQRVRVGTMDLRMAAIALSGEMVLVTRNASDFRKGQVSAEKNGEEPKVLSCIGVLDRWSICPSLIIY
jgi:predicted nucleic acid-binding protein